MKKMFNQLSDKLYSLLNHDEYLITSFYGENSQFIRFNAATIRQTGLVDDGSLSANICIMVGLLQEILLCGKL